MQKFTVHAKGGTNSCKFLVHRSSMLNSMFQMQVGAAVPQWQGGNVFHKPVYQLKFPLPAFVNE